ncbi:MAG: AAA+ family ATPase [Paracoccaceae bacterium]
MKRILPPLLISLSLSPGWAQDTVPDAPKPEVEEGFSLMEEGAKLLLRGLMSEMEPAIDEMEKALDEMAPALRQLVEMMGDIRNYHAPEKQPNGDIIIRRKTPAELLQDAPEIEL